MGLHDTAAEGHPRTARQAHLSTGGGPVPLSPKGVPIYTRELVETLLPAVWDEAYAYGMPRTDTAPDPGMPSGWTNKAHGNTLYAHLADMKSMWRTVELTRKEQRAVFMRYMLDFTMPEIAEHEISDKGTIHTRLYVAVGKIVAHLNGTEFAEGEVPE